jgi:hypothetical protein
MEIGRILEEFVRTTDAVIAAVGDAETGRVWSAGDTAREDFRWIFAEAFAGAAAVRNVHASLEHQLLPRITAQGVAHGALSRAGRWVYAAFYLLPPPPPGAARGPDERQARARTMYEESRRHSSTLAGALARVLASGSPE